MKEMARTAGGLLHDEVVSVKLASAVGLAEGPVRRGDVVGDDRTAIAGDDLEGQSLAVEVAIALPVLAPVPGHGLPSGPRPFDVNCMDVTCSANVGYEHQIEVSMAVDGESDSTALPARHPVSKQRVRIRNPFGCTHIQIGKVNSSGKLKFFGSKEKITWIVLFCSSEKQVRGKLHN
ncbi:unnamed protein product [Victoria cruziana]